MTDDYKKGLVTGLAMNSIVLRGGGSDPITAINILSDTSYSISTNKGVEQYAAVFEEDS